MQRSFRLTRSTDFQRVRRLGKSYAHPLIVLIVLPSVGSASGKTRFGVAAGRSVGNAVRRNRAKRLIRAALQPLLEKVAPGWDVVVLARQPMVNASYAQVQAALASLLHRANLI